MHGDEEQLFMQMHYSKDLYIFFFISQCHDSIGSVCCIKIKMLCDMHLYCTLIGAYLYVLQ